jgi:hypothetical protein
VGLLAFSLVALSAHTGTSPAVASVTTGCVVDTGAVLGWWRGENNLSPEVGPALVGTVGFADATVGRGLAFDPTSVASADGLPVVSDAMTVEMWVKPLGNSLGVTQALMTRWDFPSTDDAARAFALMIDLNGNLQWTTDDTTTRRPEEMQASTPQLFDGAFHHVAATWDRTQMTVYLDGTPVASKPSQGGTLNPAPTTPLRLGSKAGLGTPFPFSGVLDEPTVWGRSLSAAEISAIHAAGAGGKCTFVPVQQAKLTAATGGAIDRFGFSVGVSGTTVIAGAPFNSAFLPFSGAAFVYTVTGAGWTQQATLVATDGQVVDLFGSSVAIDADTAVVGSFANNGAGVDSGAVYVFTRTGSTWTQQAKLLAADGAAGDGFGSSVAIDGDTIVVGAAFDDDGGGDSGSAYVFTRTGTTWTQQEKLLAVDAAAADNFGQSVAVAGDTAVIGSPYDDNVDVDSGSVYVFTRSAATWTQQAKVVAGDASAGDLLGSSVGISPDTLVAGAPRDDDGGIDSGSAYVFTSTGTTWGLQSKLLASDAAGGAGFGSSVGVDGLTLAVGAPTAGAAGSQSGSAYAFHRTGATWPELTKLAADDNASGDQFGNSIAISGTIIAIGANLDDDKGINSGSAYVFAQ